jgi:hypothetical protein
MSAKLSLTILSLGALISACGPGNAQTLLRSAVDAEQDTLEGCYAKALERDETTAGVVRARLHVEKSSGLVRKVEILESVGDETLRSCMDAALTGIRIAEPAKVDVHVDYEFELVPAP